MEKTKKSKKYSAETKKRIFNKYVRPKFEKAMATMDKYGINCVFACDFGEGVVGQRSMVVTLIADLQHNLLSGKTERIANSPSFASILEALSKRIELSEEKKG